MYKIKYLNPQTGQPTSLLWSPESPRIVGVNKAYRYVCSLIKAVNMLHPNMTPEQAFMFLKQQNKVLEVKRPSVWKDYSFDRYDALIAVGIGYGALAMSLLWWAVSA
jgi:hypothetical protein